MNINLACACDYVCRTNPKKRTVRVASRSAIQATVTHSVQSQVNKTLDLTGRPEEDRGQRGKRGGKTEPARCCDSRPSQKISPQAPGWTGAGVNCQRFCPQASQRSPSVPKVWTAWLWSENWSSGRPEWSLWKVKQKNLRREAQFERKEDTKDTKSLHYAKSADQLTFRIMQWDGTGFHSDPRTCSSSLLSMYLNCNAALMLKQTGVDFCFVFWCRIIARSCSLRSHYYYLL